MPWLLLSSRRLQGHSYGIPTIGDPAGHLRAPTNGVVHSSSEAMDEEPSVPLGA